MATDPEAQREADTSTAEVHLLRATERSRLRALVAADLETADQCHADDFQLIPPGGGALSKEQYFGSIASGTINYLSWEPDSPIDVRLYGPGAVIRYRSLLDVVIGGRAVGPRRYWHTDSYEKRDGRWQAVWSQATEIQPP